MKKCNVLKIIEDKVNEIDVIKSIKYNKNKGYWIVTWKDKTKTKFVRLIT